MTAARFAFEDAGMHAAHLRSDNEVMIAIAFDVFAMDR